MVGDLVWFAIAATGLAALAKTAATLFVVIKWIGVAYLLYLAWKLWSAPAERVEVADDGPASTAGARSSRACCSRSRIPRPSCSSLALLPTVIDLASMNLVRFVEISAAMSSVLPAVLGRLRAPGGARARALHDAESRATAEPQFGRGDGRRRDRRGDALVRRPPTPSRARPRVRQPRGNTEPRCAR